MLVFPEYSEKGVPKKSHALGVAEAGGTARSIWPWEVVLEA